MIPPVTRRVIEAVSHEAMRARARAMLTPGLPAVESVAQALDEAVVILCAVEAEQDRRGGPEHVSRR